MKKAQPDLRSAILMASGFAVCNSLECDQQTSKLTAHFRKVINGNGTALVRVVANERMQGAVVLPMPPMRSMNCHALSKFKSLHLFCAGNFGKVGCSEEALCGVSKSFCADVNARRF